MQSFRLHSLWPNPIRPPLVLSISKLVLVLLCMGFCCLSASGQAELADELGSYPVRRFDLTEHGAQRQAWDIAQAANGTVAIANGAGLSLFDGTRWQLLPSPQGHPLRSVVYRRPDSSWLAGAYNAWYRWPLQPLSWSAPAAEALDPPPGEREEWWGAIAHPTEPGTTVWQTFSRMATLDTGGVTRELPLPGNILFAVADGPTLLLPVIDSGLYVGGSAGWRALPTPNVPPDEPVVGMVRAADSSLLVATKVGLYRLDPDGVRRVAANEAYASAEPNALIGLRDGTFALGTINDGLYLIDELGAVKAHFGTTQLGDATVLSLYQDLAGDLWVGLDNGVALIGLSSPAKLAFGELGAVYSVLESGNGLLLGTNQGLYRATDEGTRRIDALAGQVWHLHPSHGGVIVGHNGGTSFLDGRGQLREIGDQPGGWDWMELPDQNNLAVAATYTGLEFFELDPAGGWTSHGRVAGYEGPASQVVALANGTLLVVHPLEGLFRYEYSVSADQTILALSDIGTNDGVPGRLLGEWPGKLCWYTSAGAWSVAPSGELMRLPPEEFERGRPVQSVDEFTIYVRSDRVRVFSGADAQPSFELAARPNLEYPAAAWLDDRYLGIADTRGLALLDAEAFRRREASGYKPTPVADVRQEGRSAQVDLALASFQRTPLWRVRLGGTDTTFSNWSTVASYAFPLLPTGCYFLDFESSDGQQGTVSWTVPEHWYETSWAYLTAVLLLLGAVFAVRSYYNARLKAQRRAADVERERELQAQRLTARTEALEAEVAFSKREVEVQRRAAELQTEVAEHRTRELARSTLALARQNDFLLRVREALQPLSKSGDSGRIRQTLARLVNGQVEDEREWAFFEEHFDAVHAGFVHKLRQEHPELTPGDLRLAALLRMDLSSKEIAPLLHISVRGVENKRYRLRKKLDLDAEINLQEWILGYGATELGDAEVSAVERQ